MLLEKDKRRDALEVCASKMSHDEWAEARIEGGLVIKKRDILPSGTAWMDLKGFMPSDVSQAQKDKYRIIPFIHVESKNVKFIETESSTVYGRGCGWGNGEMLVKGHKLPGRRGVSCGS